MSGQTEVPLLGSERGNPNVGCERGMRTGYRPEGCPIVRPPVLSPGNIFRRLFRRSVLLPLTDFFSISRRKMVSGRGEWACHAWADMDSSRPNGWRYKQRAHEIPRCPHGHRSTPAEENGRVLHGQTWILRGRMGGGIYSESARNTEMSPWASLPPVPRWMGVLRWKAWIRLGCPIGKQGEGVDHGHHSHLRLWAETEGIAITKYGTS